MTTPAAGTLTSEAGLRALAAEWHDLWRRLPGSTPFQSPAWLLAWWNQFGTGRPVLGVLRTGERLLGLLPAYLLDDGEGARLLPIGAGISDTLDALLDPAAPPGSADLLLRAVLHGADDALASEFFELPPGSALRAASAPPGWLATLRQGAPCPVLTLRDAADLHSVIPPRAHRKLRMNRHRAERAGGFTVQLADAETLPACLEILFALHRSRWEDGGVLADTRVGHCLRAAACGLLADDAVRVAVLRIAGEPAAACLAFAASRRLLLYMSGYDARHAFCSPGTLLLGELAESALRDGIHEIHFLRGDEAYKYAWGAADRHNATLHLRRI